MSTKPFTFAVVSDLHLEQRHGLERYRRFAEMIRDDADIAFVLMLGDYLWPGDMDGLSALFGELGVPFSLVYGNNDANVLGELEARFGPRDRVLDVGGCRFLILWDALPADVPHNHEGVLSDEQYQWLEQQLALAKADGVETVLVAAHVPPPFEGVYQTELVMRPDAAERFESLCAAHDVAAGFFGHVHQPAHCLVKGMEWIILPSLNWNFAPPPAPPLPIFTWTQTVDAGEYVRATVGAGDISWQRVPVRLPGDTQEVV